MKLLGRDIDCTSWRRNSARSGFSSTNTNDLPFYAVTVIERSLESNDGRTVLAALVLARAGEAIKIGDFGKSTLREDRRPRLKIPSQDRMLGACMRIKFPDGRLRCCHAEPWALRQIQSDQPCLRAPNW